MGRMEDRLWRVGIEEEAPEIEALGYPARQRIQEITVFFVEELSIFSTKDQQALDGDIAEYVVESMALEAFLEMNDSAEVRLRQTSMREHFDHPRQGIHIIDLELIEFPKPGLEIRPVVVERPFEDIFGDSRLSQLRIQAEQHLEQVLLDQPDGLELRQRAARQVFRLQP